MLTWQQHPLSSKAKWTLWSNVDISALAAKPCLGVHLFQKWNGTKHCSQREASNDDRECGVMTSPNSHDWTPKQGWLHWTKGTNHVPVPWLGSRTETSALSLSRGTKRFGGAARIRPSCRGSVALGSRWDQVALRRTRPRWLCAVISRVLPFTF